MLAQDRAEKHLLSSTLRTGASTDAEQKPESCMPSRFVVVLSLLLATASATASVAAQQPTQRSAPAADFDAYVANAMKTFDAPGAAIAIVKDGKVVFAKGYGVRRLGSPTPIDTNTLFQIASNTKAFTTASLAMLVDEGKLKWDDPVTKYLPWFQLSDPYVTRELTVRDLITHRSGLGLGAGDLLWLHSNYSRDEMLRRMRYARVASSFRSKYAYDNVLYAAAGEVVAAASGKSWDEFVRERILQPLGMTDVLTGVAGLSANADMASPHSVIDGRQQLISLDSVDVIAPAGGIIASVSDIAKWMIVQLDSGRVGNTRLWNAARTRDMWSGQTIIPIAPPSVPALAPVTPNFSEYGLGWDLQDYRGHKIVTHTGGLGGMTSRTLLVPDARLGIIMLTNSETPLINVIPFRAMDDMLGTPRLDWTAIRLEASRKARESAAGVEARAASTRNRESKPSLPLAKYAGNYNDAMYGDASITEENGHLVLRFAHSPEFTGDLEHWQYDTFVAHWRTKTIPDAYVTFSLTASGDIDTMKMAAVSPLADFSYDYQDLLFHPMPKNYSPNPQR
jgi:CubicO group peptidase (beta-lactamase class C family)